MKTLRTSIVAAALVAGLGAAPLAVTAAGAASSGGTVIAASNSAFGKILVVGSGQYAGYTVYMLTSDRLPSSFGCTTTVQQLPFGSLACTGPEGSLTEWPAVTTTAPPVAGPGVKQSLLGTVTRDLGTQVTYAGHPLYLFDTAAGQVTGEGWDETGLPADHGVWYTVSPKGEPVPWAQMLTTSSIAGRTVLSAQFETGAGWQSFPVYSFSKSSCTGTCAQSWLPLLTAGIPGVSGLARSGSVGTKAIAGGLHQVTYDGHPLYLYGDETPSTAGGVIKLVGSGNDKKDAGGTFRLVRI